MATARPFAYNTGSTISGTLQVGDIAIGDSVMDYSGDPGVGGVKWWMGPDEEPGYVIICPVPSFSQSTPVGIGAGVEFWRSNGLTDQAFIDITGVVARRKGYFTPITSVSEAGAWLTLSGFPTTYGVIFEPESVALFARMDEQPNDALKSLINITIKGLKDDGVWSSADCLYIRGVHAAQAATLNWIKNDHNSTLVNSPTFTPYVGFKGDAISNYINNNYIPSTQAIKLGAENVTIGFMISVLPTPAFSPIMGCVQNPISFLELVYALNSNDRAKFNFSGDYDPINWNINKIYTYNRTGTTMTHYAEGIKAADSLGWPTLSLPSYSFYELGANGGGTAVPSDTEIFFSFIGGFLNNTKSVALYNRIKYFYDNIDSTIFEPETMILLNRMVEKPTRRIKDLINTTIKGLKDDGVWSKGDCLYVRGVHTAQAACQNWIKDAHNSTLVNSPAFIPYSGFSGDGVSKYINNNYRPFQDAENYKLDDSSIIIISNKKSSINISDYCGAVTSIPFSRLEIKEYTAANERAYMNSSTSNANLNTQDGDIIGYSRINSSIQGYLNGAPVGVNQSITTDDNLTTNSIYELGSSYADTINYLSDALIFSSWYGGYLDSVKQLSLYKRMAYLYDGIMGYEKESLDLFYRMDVEPNRALKDLINTTIKGLKNDGVWDLADCLYVRGVHTAQAACQNWIKDAHNSTLVNSPTFMPAIGFKGDGVSMYMNDHYSPYSDGINLSNNNATIATRLFNTGTVSRWVYGVRANTNVYFGILLNTGPTADLAYMAGSNVNNQINIIENDIVSYSKSTSIQGYINGGAYGSNVYGGSLMTLPDYELYEMTIDYEGVVSFFKTDVGTSLTFLGGYLNATKNLAFYNRIKYYYDNVLNTFTYGNEMIVNGGFDTDTGWTKQVGWTISGGTANYDDINDIKYIIPQSSVNFTSGKVYKFTYTVTGLTAGSAVIAFRNQSASGFIDFNSSSTLSRSNGTYIDIGTCFVTSTNITIFSYTASGSAWSLDDLSIKEMFI